MIPKIVSASALTSQVRLLHNSGQIRVPDRVIGDYLGAAAKRAATCPAQPIAKCRSKI
jgi:hypothetical protein